MFDDVFRPNDVEFLIVEKFSREQAGLHQMTPSSRKFSSNIGRLDTKRLQLGTENVSEQIKIATISAANIQN